MKRPRKVFGRTRTTTGGRQFVIEMSKTELQVRLWHGPKDGAHKITLAKLVPLVMMNAPLRHK